MTKERLGKGQEMYLEMIDRAKPQKLYHQLLEILKGFIERGQWRVGAQIPTEEQLCDQFNVSKATVRLALGELVLLGYLKRIQGKGTFVRRKRSGNSITMFLDLNESESPGDISCVVRILETQICQPEEEIKDYLCLPEGSSCTGLKRLVIAEGVPLKIERIYISRGALRPVLTGDEFLTDLSIYSLVENRCGIRIHKVKEIHDLFALDTEDSNLLEMAPGLALRIRHICYVNSLIPAVYIESLHRTDLYPKTFEFERLS